MCIQVRTGFLPTLSLFEAMEKQLGLRLEKQKHPLPVLVIDHMLDTPTEN
ncbi:MAG TPA: TIGR03435 family protein [Acidobacteriaceae bacterium]|jgi:uncharacterized protein (TIGR03435 family)|nr:TIGR03435 family protein [Acidobacteriaceae bacterium]